jgi:murein DD-endopeptidase MepM/ murein hydrolase activator NlpD
VIPRAARPTAVASRRHDRGPAAALFVLILSAWLLAPRASAQSFALVEVRPGDAVGAIAQRYGVDVEVLLETNDLAGHLIRPGDVLRVPLLEARGGVAEPAPEPPPGFRRHTLASGETLTEIVERYGITMTALVGANPDLSSLDRLPVGVELLIPPGEGLVVGLEHGVALTDLIAAYGADPAAVARANQLRGPFDVRPGMLLFLPGVAPVAALERLAHVRELENTYVWPLHGRLTSYYGRRNLGLGTSSFHRGLDIAAPTGSTIVAARSGTVTFAGWSDRGYGNLVKIRHAGGAETWYAHASRLFVRVGESVSQGEAIAAVGSTGISTGPHLHLELHVQGVAIDPLSELR